MQAGRLDRLITIRRNTPTTGSDGGQIDSWSNIGGLRRPASMRPLSGDERFNDPQYVAKEQIEFRIRYADSVADLTPLDQVIYPALTAQEIADSPQPDLEERRIHDVLAVHEIGRREGLQIVTVRRADVTS
jgi:head-tail adaptor